MRAVTYPAYSTDLSTVRVEERPDPRLAPSAVLIEVKAAAVNPVDWKVMAGGLDGLMEAVFPADPGLGRRRAWSPSASTPRSSRR